MKNSIQITKGDFVIAYTDGSGKPQKYVVTGEEFVENLKIYKMKKVKKVKSNWKLSDFIALFLATLGLWIAITSAIYSFSNPKKTQTEAFLHIPKSMILDFGG